MKTHVLAYAIYLLLKERFIVHKLNASQLFIFTLIFLMTSLASNLILLASNNDLSRQLDAQKITNNDLTEENEALNAEKSQQQQRLENFGSQQNDVSEIVARLQNEMSELANEYQRSIETATLLDNRLSEANKEQQQLLNQYTQSKQALASTQRSLEDARKTMTNQQRALRRLSQTSQTPINAELQQSFLINANQMLLQQFPEITMTERADGKVSIDIPNTSLFTEGDVNFNEQSDKLIKILADLLKNHQNTFSQVTVIGHADARPITSDLRFRYPTNWALSSARASLLVADLIQQGLPNNRFTAAGKAANTPIRDGGSDSALAANRRVEMLIVF